MSIVDGGIADLVSKKVVCKIYSCGNLVRDQVIGSCEINLAEIACGPVHQDHKMLDSRGRDTGRIQFNCQGSITIILFVKYQHCTVLVCKY